MTSRSLLTPRITSWQVGSNAGAQFVESIFWWVFVILRPMDLFYMLLAGLLTGVGIVLTTHGAFEYVRIARILRRRSVR
jgi:hypothetical protein